MCGTQNGETFGGAGPTSHSCMLFGVLLRRTSLGLFGLTLASACGFEITPSGSGPGDAGGSDAGGTDGMAAVCPWPYTPEYVSPCPARMGAAIELLDGDTVLDTGSGTLSGATTMLIESEIVADVRIVWTTGLRISPDATLRVIGGLPLVVVATGSITIEGELDGAGRVNAMDRPAGANPAACGDLNSGGAKTGAPCSDQGASGGGGGSFGTVGGQGGGGGETRDCGVISGPVPGGSAGVAVAARPMNLRGGCSGAAGGPSQSSGALAGTGGMAGGAIALVARNTLAVDGTINVGGAGGGGGADRSGGGGGGSGGMIVLEASTVTVATAGRVSANGGGGGGGCDNNKGDDGQDGRDGANAANGGAREGSGTDGGDGGAHGIAAQPAEISTRAGGGGGGGVGFVRVHSLNPAQAGPASFSPAPSP